MKKFPVPVKVVVKSRQTGKNSPVKILFFVIICGSLLGIVFFIEFAQYDSSERIGGGKRLITGKPAELVQAIACHLPNLIPFHESIAQYTNDSYPKINCEEDGYPLIFGTDLNSNILTLRNPMEFGLENCCFRPFIRANENKIKFSSMCYPISDRTTRVSESFEFIVAECYNKNKGLHEAVDMFTFTRLKSQIEKRVEKIRRKMAQGSTIDIEDQVNVLILGLDGMSHMNFIRTMPLTHKFLLKNLSAIGMNGYNKVGDNTFPNLVAVLSGLSEEELKSVCWRNQEDYFDDCPFIWKDFRRLGYRTGFAEDATPMGLFNYMKRGFKYPPTDYYLRTLTHAQEDWIGHKEPDNSKLCYGPRLAPQVLFDNLKDLAKTMGMDRRYFQLTWTSSLFHDYLTSPTLADRPLLETLQWLQESGYLNQTVLILMSDHGIRYGPIRSTIQGQMEESMPLLYFSFPPWFSRKYPVALEYFKINSQRLTTPFDLHFTLLDLLSLHNIENISKTENVRSDSGISLFLPISISRTCASAGIAEHWCVCNRNGNGPISAEKDIVKKLADKVISELNRLVESFPQCSKLKLGGIISAQSLSSDYETSSGPLTMTLILSTLPNDAVFEATITSSGDISGEISRISLYGNESHCVQDYKVKKYCYCPP